MKHPTALRPGLLRRLLRRPSARLSLLVLACVFLGAIFLPFALNYQSQTTSSDAFLAPNTNHLFGTDLNGRDVLARTLQGARISLLVGCAGALVSLGIGTSVGLLAGYVGGRVDALLMRLVDVLYAVPDSFSSSSWSFYWTLGCRSPSPQFRTGAGWVTAKSRS